VQSGHRTCTLYSQFNLPSAVVIEINLNSTLNNNINAAEITMMNNNPQNGATVPQAFKDANLNTTPDDDAVSGYVLWTAHQRETALTIFATL
jgi:peptidoglycan hydrolase-like protein with peptidoglycan-binding domain